MIKKFKYYFATLILVFAVLGLGYSIYLAGPLIIVCALGGFIVTWALVTVLTNLYEN